MGMHKVLIVEDEPLARGILEGYVSQIPTLSLSASIGNALEAFGILATQQIDLILLDINLPDINGMKFIKSVKHAPAIIFTTAYPDFALESYELNAIDYLLKPISFERFQTAIDKFLNKDLGSNPTENPSKNNLFVRSEGKWMNMEIPKIKYIEALKDYVKVHLEDERLVIHSTMKNFEEQLKPYAAFVRVHKSFIVNLHWVQQIDGNQVYIDGQTLAIGATYKDELQSRLKKFNF